MVLKAVLSAKSPIIRETNHVMVSKQYELDTQANENWPVQLLCTKIGPSQRGYFLGDTGSGKGTVASTAKWFIYPQISRSHGGPLRP